MLEAGLRRCRLMLEQFKKQLLKGVSSIVKHRAYFSVDHNLYSCKIEMCGWKRQGRRLVINIGEAKIWVTNIGGAKIFWKYILRKKILFFLVIEIFFLKNVHFSLKMYKFTSFSLYFLFFFLSLCFCFLSCLFFLN